MELEKEEGTKLKASRKKGNKYQHRSNKTEL